MTTQTNHSKSELYFLLVLLAIVLVITFFIFKPFLYALVFAVIFATIFGSLHRKMLGAMPERSGLAAFLSTLIVLAVVIIPFTLFGVQIFQEASVLYSSLTSNGGIVSFSHSLEKAINNLDIFSTSSIKISLNLSQYFKPGLNWVLQNLGFIFSNVAQIMASVFISLIALYYLFKDGEKFKRIVVALSPLEDIHDEVIFSKLKLAINSVVRGSLAVAVVQGVFTAVGFAVFGISNAVFWGSVAIVAALIPGIGTALVMIPAIIYLFVIGNVLSAVGLFVWGVIVVGLVDNFLRPKLVERATRLHPFLVLLSIFGGVSFFGPLGFLLGPLVLSLLFALLEIYPVIRDENLK